MKHKPDPAAFRSRLDALSSPARRRLLRGFGAAAGVAALGRWPEAQAQPAAARETLRIGYQKYGTLTVLKARGDLEKRLAPLGLDVQWIEFPAGPQLLEGLNVGSIDFGTVGEAPPIFAQAAGAPIVYIAHQPPAPAAEAIVVPKDSPLKRVADLRGKRVAFNKGSNVHYLLLRALQPAGVPYAEVQTVYLPPADARAAFERGSVDAWVIWDPFLAAAERQLGARVLADGTGLVANHQFYLASRAYAGRRPEVLKAVVEELARLDAWAAGHPGEVARLLAPQIGLDLETTERSARRFAYGVRPVDAEVARQQQKIADAFHALRLIPKPLKIADALPAGVQLAQQ